MQTEIATQIRRCNLIVVATTNGNQTRSANSTWKRIMSRLLKETNIGLRSSSFSLLTTTTCSTKACKK